MRFFKVTSKNSTAQNINYAYQFDKNSLAIILSYLNPNDLKTFINFSSTSKGMSFLFRELVFLYGDQHHRQLIEASFQDITSMGSEYKKYSNKIKNFKLLKENTEAALSLLIFALTIGCSLYLGLKLNNHLDNCNLILRIFSISMTIIGSGIVSLIPIMIAGNLDEKYKLLKNYWPMNIIEEKMENKLSKMSRILFITPKDIPSKIAHDPDKGRCTIL